MLDKNYKIVTTIINCASALESPRRGAFFYLLLRRSISDHYLRSCGYVTCSRPQRTATRGLEPGTSRPKVLGFTTAPVRSTNTLPYDFIIEVLVIQEKPHYYDLVFCDNFMSTELFM